VKYRHCLLKRHPPGGASSTYYVCWLPEIIAIEGSEIRLSSLEADYRIEAVYKHVYDGKELDHIAKIQRKSGRILERHE